MKLNEAIAKRLNLILQEKRLSPYSLAQKGGISKQVVYSVVNCEYKKVSTDTIFQITATLNMSLKDFFDDDIFKDITD